MVLTERRPEAMMALAKKRAEVMMTLAEKHRDLRGDDEGRKRMHSQGER
jgi:hypothetical protein